METNIVDNNYSLYLKKFKISVTILGLALLVAIAMIAKTVPEIQKTIQIQEETKTKSGELADAERKLTELRTAAEQRDEQDSSV